MSIARAGWTVIARCLFSAAAGYIMCFYPAWRPGGLVVCAAGLIWALFAAYFFRDPQRPCPEMPPNSIPRETAACSP